MDRIEIVVCVDKWFVMPTGVMMYSVCMNNPNVDIRFHVIADDSVPELGKDDLREMVEKFSGKEIVFYDIDITRFPSFPKVSVNLTQASYYRLLLSEILSKELHKVLYLDGDMIVRHSLLPLWTVDLKEDIAIAAVSESSECNIEFYNRLQYSMSLGYFNAGVLLVNLDYWRNNNVVKIFFEYMINYPNRIIWLDQDVLNYVFRHNKTELPIKYNLERGHLAKTANYDYWKREQEVWEARRDPVIVHFTSIDKPWNRKLLQPPHPFSSTFFKYQEQTKWKGERIDKRSRKQRMRDFVEDLLRRCRIIRPCKIWRVSKFIDLDPID
jgi:lipopolysaccharide biosynthesis glycosyltransferase